VLEFGGSEGGLDGHLLGGARASAGYPTLNIAYASLLGPGDTPLANTDADARLWPDVLSFLADPAGRTGTFTAPATPPALNAL